MTKNRICVVIVTYNRKELLFNLLGAISRQSVPVDAIVIVDNKSSDGTIEFLKNNQVINDAEELRISTNKWKNMDVHYYLNDKNTGGSGGFEKAFELANNMDYDYIWAMDDDVEPEADCLEKLISNIDEHSKVCIPSRNDDRWTDQLVIDYNLTNPFLVNLKQYKKRINSLSLSNGTQYVVDMPLEGPLISMDVSREIGTPNSEYFIMYDDTDFAYRLSQVTNIKYVKEARLHRKLVKAELGKSEWTWKEYYLLRNSFVFDRKYGKNWLVRHYRPLHSCIAKIISALVQKKVFRAKIIIMAYSDAINRRMGKQLEPGTKIELI